MELPRVFHIYPMASADTEELRRTYWGSRRRLKAAILESAVVKVRLSRARDNRTYVLYFFMSRELSITPVFQKVVDIHTT